MSTVFEEILAERQCGTVHCGTTASADLESVARAFGLKTDQALYREIERDVARTLIRDLLHRDLAYSCEVIPLERGAALAEAFLMEAAKDGCRYFTNVMMFPAPTASDSGGKPGWSWNPATEATFDMGVLVVAERGSACFWVEEED